MGGQLFGAAAPATPEEDMTTTLLDDDEDGRHADGDAPPFADDDAPLGAALEPAPFALDASTAEDGADPGDVFAAMVDEAASAAAGALILRPRADLFMDAELRSMHSRAVAYLRAGAPVHFRGPAGAGKTTLALHVAAWLGRPVSMVTGDSRMTSADLLGREVGETTTRLHDRYVSRVVKTASATRVAWSDSALTEAMTKGWTLIYDEFTRAPAEANNALLSALEERVLILSNPASGRRYVRAHPEFRAILTSNPEEYAGVSAAPDALFDRMVTFDLSWSDHAAERGIVASRTGLDEADADVVVRLVRAVREAGSKAGAASPASLRTAILLGRIMAALGVKAQARDERFAQICLDVLDARAPRGADGAGRAAHGEALRAAIRDACRPARPANPFAQSASGATATGHGAPGGTPAAVETEPAA